LTTLGSEGSGPGQFTDPDGVAVSGNRQTVWVIDRINTDVSVWTRQTNGDWTFDTEIGSFGDGANQWRGPLGVAVAADVQTAFVSDLGHDRISMWTWQSNGTWAHDRNLGNGEGSGLDQFNGPFGLAVSADGQMFWVTDAGNHRVSVWSPSGCPPA
jgi:tripartite motif-containing protein 2/3/tripartite motif-containing protein 71